MRVEGIGHAATRHPDPPLDDAVSRAEQRELAEMAAWLVAQAEMNCRPTGVYNAAQYGRRPRYFFDPFTLLVIERQMEHRLSRI